jgi:pteridine reductase
MPNSKVMLITGAGRRIGRALAEYFHERGFAIIAHYCQSADAADALVKQFNAVRPDSGLAVAADLGEPAAIERLAKQAIDWKGKIDVVINNASVFYKTQLGQPALAAWDDNMNVNARGPYLLMNALASALRVSGGVVVNITDPHKHWPLKDYGIYNVSKAALSMVTQVLARELAPECRVNSVAPGIIIWPEGDNALSEAQKTALVAQTALKRAGVPLDVAVSIEFLIQSPYISGQTLNVDGGRNVH